MALWGIESGRPSISIEALARSTLAWTRTANDLKSGGRCSPLRRSKVIGQAGWYHPILLEPNKGAHASKVPIHRAIDQSAFAEPYELIVAFIVLAESRRPALCCRFRR